MRGAVPAIFEVKKMNYIYSTLTADNEYSTEVGPIVIFGRNGAYLRGKIETPRGVATRVTEEQLQALEKHPLFITHKKNGFINIQTKELTETKSDKLIKDEMNSGDKSAQETEQTMKSKTKANKTKG
jgi:hypothetical protein